MVDPQLREPEPSKGWARESTSTPFRAGVTRCDEIDIVSVKHTEIVAFLLVFVLALWLIALCVFYRSGVIINLCFVLQQYS